MAEEDASHSSVPSRLEEELLRELLGDRDAFFLLPVNAADTSLQFPRETLTNRLSSTAYSGPTIEDVEAALSMRYGVSTADSGSHGGPRATIALPEKGLCKMETKFIVRVKRCENGIADDGYRWRKYGQKSIRNSPHPRSYYRCTNPRCNAKKQVERSAEDPETLLVTYEGLHRHYAYSHFLLPRPAAASADSSAKRAKLASTAAPTNDPTPRPPTGSSPAAPPPPPTVSREGRSWPPELGDDAGSVPQGRRGEVAAVQSSQEQLRPDDLVHIPQGLLEDIIPLLAREPCSITGSTISSDLSFSSVPSSPLSSSSSSPSPFFSWTPHDPSIFDLDVVSVASSSLASCYSSPLPWSDGDSFLDMNVLSGAV